MTSSPFRPGASVEEQLAYYKAQYEQLEVELHEFQASSKELEAELERDVEESEKRERKLKEQVESLGFEVDEWKTKSKQSRDEANRAQTTLQKEITTMRDTNRSLQLKLRDIEVANDNYETQARNTTSSLEDMESKYNVAIERGVLLEEEVRSGEKEREQLRIDAQRLRDELSDLRVEFEITLEKLHHTEAALERSHTKRLPLHANPARPMSTSSEVSAVTPPSPIISTSPAPKSEASTPPSPPLSDTIATNKVVPKTPLHTVRKSLLNDGNTTPRPSKMPSRMPRHSQGQSLSGIQTPSGLGTSRMGPPRPRPNAVQPENLPRSGSLYQIKGLIGRMQKIEERVQSVRSRLPPSKVPTPTRNSPRTAPPAADGALPITVTMRSGKKRPSNVSAASSRAGDDSALPPPLSFADRRTGGTRLSFGVGANSAAERPGSSSAALSRPSSRASNASNPEQNPFVRPSSRISMSGGARTPLSGHYPVNHAMPPATQIARPRSSFGGRGHGHSASISEIGEVDVTTPTPRRTTLDRQGVTGIRGLTMTPSTAGSTGAAGSTLGGRRQSNGLVSKPSMQNGLRSMAPPAARKASGVGETY